MSKDPPTVAAVVYHGLCTFEFGIAVEGFGLPDPSSTSSGTDSPCAMPNPVR